MEAKSKLKLLTQKLNDLVTESKEKEVQTEKKCETVIELSEELCSGDKIFVCSTIWDTKFIKVHQISSHLNHCRSIIDLHESNLDLCRSNLKSGIRPR